MSYAISLIQRGIIQSKIQEQITIKKKQNRKVIIYILALLIILFSVIYIVQANSVATSGYKIREYNNAILKLQSENKILELKLSEVRSLNFLEEKVKSLNLNMVKAERVEYLSPVSQVAAR